MVVHMEEKEKDKTNGEYWGRDGGATEIIISYYDYQCLLRPSPQSGIYLTPSYTATTYVKMILHNAFPTLERRLN